MQARRPRPPSGRGPDRLVVTWNKELIKILGIPGEQPAAVHPTRSFALLQAAEYDAVNSITHRDRPYLFTVRAARDARPDAAADQAAHDVLAALYPDMRGELGAVLRTELAKIPGRRGRSDGTEVGAAVARHLLELRAHDGSAATPPPFTGGNRPGDYRPTPPTSPPRCSPADTAMVPSTMVASACSPRSPSPANGVPGLGGQRPGRLVGAGVTGAPAHEEQRLGQDELVP